MLPESSQRGATQFHAENQPGERAFHVAFHFGLATVPTTTTGKRRIVALCANHDYRILVGLRFRDIATHDFIESLREKLIAQVVSIKRDAGNGPVTSSFVGP